MCLILFAHDVHPRYRLVVAANRDEFYDRPTEPAGWWREAPSVLAGRDRRSGGTWIGVTRSGRFAAITNYREPGGPRDGTPSRGGLVLGFLTNRGGAADYLELVRRVAGDYNGFNLLVADEDSLWLYSNRDEATPRALEPGVHGLSNHLLDTPWPKLVTGAARLRAALDLEGDVLVDRLLGLLEDRTVPPDAELPSTGVGVELERLLAPAFIASPGYGTRASYAVLLDRSGEITVVERPFDAGGPSGDPVRFTYQMTDC